MGRQSRHPRCRARQQDLRADLPSRRSLLSRRRARQPGRHRIHRQRRGDHVDRTAAPGGAQEPANSRGAHREAGRPDRGALLPPAGGGRGDRDGPPHGVADLRLRLHADRRLLPGQHLPRFSHQRLSDVQVGEVELRRRSGTPEAVYSYMMPLEKLSNFQRIRNSYIDAYLYRRYSMYMNRLGQAFAALADPTRRGIVVHLARGEASVSDLVGLFSLTQPTISSHLKVLESAGLISRSRVAQSRPCKLETEQLKAVTDWLEQVQEIWEGNYKRLDALLAELKQAQKEEGKK